MVVLECSNAGCKLGPKGTKWSTTSLPIITATQLVMDHVETNHLVYGDYPGVEENWIGDCSEEHCDGYYNWENACSPLQLSRQQMYNIGV
jgi:hypothetical protein